jgi:PEP-CTERM motif
MNRYFQNRQLVVLATMVVATAASSAWAGFTPGSLVLINATRTGNAATPMTESVQLLEYNVSGAVPALINTYNMPNVVLPSVYDNDRQLKLSADGKLLTFAGYNTAAGQNIDLLTSSTAVAPREIVKVGPSGTATNIGLNPSYYDGVEIASAATQDGSQFWVAGENTKNSLSTTGGPRWFSGNGATSFNLYTPADQAGIGTASVRSVGIYGGQLYYSSGSSSFGSNKGVSALGTGVTVPVADVKLSPKVVINGGINESTTDFVFLDSNHDGSSDLAYTIRNSGIQKLLFDGTNWLDKGLIMDPNGTLKAITARSYSNGGVLQADVFAVSAAGEMFKITDTNVATNVLAGGLPAPYLMAAAGYQFGGVDFAPVPEPSTVALMVVGCQALIALMGRRRRA